jgi:hypothetical protein
VEIPHMGTGVQDGTMCVCVRADPVCVSVCLCVHTAHTHTAHTSLCSHCTHVCLTVIVFMRPAHTHRFVSGNRSRAN